MSVEVYCLSLFDIVEKCFLVLCCVWIAQPEQHLVENNT